jgi:uncharacterized membrane protein
MYYLSYIFAIIYILIDIFYIVQSNLYYDKVVRKIQKRSMNNMNKNGIYISALIAYLILAIGWLYFIASRIELKITYYNLFILCLVYSLCIYGVFNSTLYIMFKDWTINVALRDTFWGFFSITIFSILYKFIFDKFI